MSFFTQQVFKSTNYKKNGFLQSFFMYELQTNEYFNTQKKFFLSTFFKFY